MAIRDPKDSLPRSSANGSVVNGASTEHLEVTQILLDPENPRLDAKPDADQATLRALLVAKEDVIGLANEIIKNGGLLPTDRIVVVRHRTKYLVLEGNRRTCACQLIQDPGLLPEAERGRLRPPTEDLRKIVARMDAVIVPHRDAAMKLIATRHTKRGVRPWRPAAKSRYVGRLFREGRNVAEIARLMSMGVSQVKRALLDFHLLNVARHSKVLTAEERTYLGNLALKTNAFTRFFTLKEGRRYFPTSVTDQGELLHPGLSSDEFSALAGSLAKLYLLPRPGGDEPEFTTRSNPNTAIAAAAVSNSTVRAVVDKADSLAPEQSKVRPHLKPVSSKAKFFEGFSCPPNVRNTALIHLANEISQIPYRRHSISATFLARSLIEQVLHFCIVHARLQKDFFQLCGGRGRDPGLGEIIDFVRDHRASIFRYPDSASTSLGLIKKHKAQMDKTVHGTVLAAQTKLEEIASDTRVFLERVLNGQELL
jgi:hypothetical protein